MLRDPAFSLESLVGQYDVGISGLLLKYAPVRTKNITVWHRLPSQIGILVPIEPQRRTNWTSETGSSIKYLKADSSKTKKAPKRSNCHSSLWTYLIRTIYYILAPTKQLENFIIMVPLRTLPHPIPVPNTRTPNNGSLGRCNRTNTTSKGRLWLRLCYLGWLTSAIRLHRSKLRKTERVWRKSDLNVHLQIFCERFSFEARWKDDLVLRRSEISFSSRQ